MRRLSTLLLCSLLVATAYAGDVSIVRVWPQWRNADAFDRVREYFGGKENDGRDLVVRTHPEERAGLYFLVRVKGPSAIVGKFVIELIRPDDPTPKTYTFPVDLPPKIRVAELGLTAGDWPGGRTAHPVAWKITLVDAENHPLASEHSFLWEKPAQ